MKPKILHHRNIGHDTTACGLRGLAKWRCTYRKEAATCKRCRMLLGLSGGTLGYRKPPKKAERLPVGLPPLGEPQRPSSSGAYLLNGMISRLGLDPTPNPDDFSAGDWIDRKKYAAELQGVRAQLAEWDRVSTTCVSPGETLGTGNKLAMAVLLLVQKL